MVDLSTMDSQPIIIDDRNDVWEKFINNEPVDTSVLRPDILDSWQRCKDTVDPRRGSSPEILPAKEFERIRIKNKELIDIAVPVMEGLFNFVKGSDYSIGLLAVENEDLIYLEFICTERLFNEHKKLNAIGGSNWAEKAMGTTSMSLALYHNRPFQLYPYENWCAGMREVTTSAAPIHDPDSKEKIGVLLLGSIYSPGQFHTLGMVVAAVDSIEKQIAISRLARKAEISNHFKTVIMESFTDGIIALDEFGGITHVNQKALRILDLEQSPEGQNIFRVLDKTYGTVKNYQELCNVINSNAGISDRLVSIRDARCIVRCVVSTRCLNSDGKSLGKIMIIQKFSRAVKLASNTFGNYARFTFADLIGQDRGFLDGIKVGIKVAKTSSNVLLLGESGVGKDLFAQAIHNASSRQGQPYLAINCAAIPRDLLGSELFGYVEGAFTGAKKGGSPGKFELADRGTIFLDEIGEMPLDMQVSLLRVLEEKAVTRIGDKRAIPMDVRIIAATNKDLTAEVERGNFREDLYYRINVVNIELPSLRDRRGDIPLLIDHFVGNLADRIGKTIKNITTDVYCICAEYDWPGNIRELQNVIERGVNLAEGDVFNADLLPKRLLELSVIGPQNLKTRDLRLRRRTIEQSAILNCIEYCKGNLTLAAKQLGISRSTLYRKLCEGDLK